MSVSGSAEIARNESVQPALPPPGSAHGVQHGMIVDFKNPPPWAVVVSFADVGDVTWPFPTEEGARIAYALAVGSGQFTRVLRKASKTAPAMIVTLVSLWRLREIHVADDGKRTPLYSGVLVEPAPEPQRRVEAAG